MAGEDSSTTREESGLSSPQAQPDKAEPEGDFGGPFGYGHPAHKPDPAARYGFRPEIMRVLPVKSRARWR